MDIEANVEPSGNENDSPQDVIDAKNLFRFLAEVKKLSSPVVRDFENYEQVIWASEIHRYPGCFTKIWELIGQPSERTSLTTSSGSTTRENNDSLQAVSKHNYT